MIAASPPPLDILLAQGPVGGFFRRLSHDLRRRGHRVRRLVFNGGDVFFALGGDFEIVRARDGDFAPVFERMFEARRPDLILAFGDERPIHKVMSAVARAHGIPVWFFEEGYIRPDHVTLEADGNNANSSVLATFDRFGPQPPPPTAPRLRGQPRRLAWVAMWYFIIHRCTRFFFPGYTHHRERRLVAEFRFYWRGVYRRLAAKRHDEALVARLSGPNPPRFFVVALQVHDDLQLVRHGRGWRTKTFIDMILASFERAAPPETMLVIKAHPLDIGYGHHGSELGAVVERSVLRGRVFYLTSGPAAPVVREAAGMVTINSTMGMVSLRHGVPTLVFGDVFYDAPGLATKAEGEEDLDRFWTAPAPVDLPLAQRFHAHVFARALLPGGFYVRESWPGLTEAIAERIGERMSEPDGAPPDRGAMP